MLPRPVRNRAIQLDAPLAVKPAEIPDHYYYKNETHREDSIEIIERERIDDVMHIRKWTKKEKQGDLGPEMAVTTKEITLSAIIDFQALIDKADVSPDDDREMPWDDSDGWEHDLVRFGYDGHTGGTLEDFVQARGYIHQDRHRYAGSHRVIVTDESYCGESRAARIASFHCRGAAKQVAREMVAQQDREYIDQLVKWHETGYPCIGVTIRVKIGGEEYEDSCWGYETDYQAEAVREIAGCVACSLEDDGYTVTGFSNARTDYATTNRRMRIQHIRDNLHMFDLIEKP